MNAIEATDVTKTYGDITALDGLSLSIEAGSTFGLLGTNGAGKSTLFKLLVNHIEPDSGTIRVAGRDVATAGPDVRRAVGYLPERTGFPDALTAREVLEFHARVRGLTAGERSDRIGEALETVGLEGAADRRVGGFSNGMNRRLGLATALLARPHILLLDEPTAGLDPLGVTAFHRIVRRLRAESELTVVLSSHVLSEVEALCDSVAVLHDGELRTAGAIDEVRRAVDGTLRVEVRVDPTTGHDPVFEATVDLAEISRAAGELIELRATPDDVPTILDRLVGLECVTGFEVHEPGLATVFDRLDDEQRTESPEVVA